MNMDKEFIELVLNRVENILAGKYICVSVIGAVNPHNADYECLGEKTEKYKMENEPFKRYINTKDVSTIYEHGENTIMVLGMESIIVSACFLEMGIELGYTTEI